MGGMCGLTLAEPESRGRERICISLAISLGSRRGTAGLDVLQLEPYLVQGNGSILFLGHALEKVTENGILFNFGNLGGIEWGSCKGVVLGPVAAVEGAVLDGFGDVGDGDGGGGFEVGDGAGDFEDAVVGAGAEALLLHGALEEAFGVGGELAEGADLLGRHLGVGEDGAARGARAESLGARWVADSVLEEAGVLELAGGEDAGADLGGAFGGGVAAELLVLDGGDFDVDVDAVEEGAADFGDVALDHGRGAHALAGLVVEVAAGAGVHGGGEHEAGGKGEATWRRGRW